MIKLIGECYLNHCIAKRLVDELKRIGIGAETIAHRPRGGRDRILKEACDVVQKALRGPLIIVIDYEEGVMRRYVDSAVEFVCRVGSVLVGKLRRCESVIAIVFDPKPEDVLNIPHHLRDEVRSRTACSVVERRGDINAMVDMLVNELAHAVARLLTSGEDAPKPCPAPP